MKKKMAKGVLPSNKWLIKNEYAGLIECMKKHPEMFAHIQQEKELTKKGNQSNG